VPAYRTIYLICKSPPGSDLERKLDRLRGSSSDTVGNCLDELARQSQFAELHARIALLLEQRQKALTDAQFLANSRQEHIRLLNSALEERRAPFWRRLIARWKSRRRGR
jgi:hypothetical protein